jgi:hypothetical protein
LTPQAAPRSLNDEDFETLAVVRDDTLTRVGSVASVVATTSNSVIGVCDTAMNPLTSMLRKSFFERKKREGVEKEERRGFHRTPAQNELQDD